MGKKKPEPQSPKNCKQLKEKPEINQPIDGTEPTTSSEVPSHSFQTAPD